MAKERRLYFVKREYEQNCYEVYNYSKNELICLVKKERLGAYMHWQKLVPKELFFNRDGYWNGIDYYTYSGGCEDEIREFMKNPDKYKEKYPEQVK